MIRSRAVVAAVVITGFAVLCGTTVAYSFDADSAENIFCVGSQVSEICGAEAGSGTGGITVENTGTADCFVRVFAAVADPGSGADIDGLINKAGWTERQEDGFFYYREMLAPGERTAPLMEGGAQVETGEPEIIIYEETVQAAGSEDPLYAF